MFAVQLVQLVGFVAQRWGGGHMDWGPGAWIMMSLLFLVWLGIMAMAAWAVATFVRHQSGPRIEQRETPLEIARRRYASGEINAEEFERLRRDLG